ncbi:MAG TPA: transcriptional repressor [Polyangia bacterium]|nr:transcriptional repressor [Polyangia bacterium]
MTTMSTIRHADPKSLKTQWGEFLRRQGLKTTHQREAIVDIFLRSEGHVSIEELLARVRRRHPRVGYATVYRTLKLLAASGLAAARQFGDGQTRYEVAGDTEHHDHMICQQCGLIVEFHDEDLERMQDEIARRLGGFQVVRHKHELYGLCPKAQGIKGGYCPNEVAPVGRPTSHKPHMRS